MTDSTRIELLVETELDRISDTTLREALRAYLIPPRIHYRNWEYSNAPERYPCWLVADFHPEQWGVAYSEYGHGSHSHWGVVSLIQDSFGMDSQWFRFLEDAFIHSGFWKGPLPEGYEVR